MPSPVCLGATGQSWSVARRRYNGHMPEGGPHSSCSVAVHLPTFGGCQGAWLLPVTASQATDAGAGIVRASRLLLFWPLCITYVMCT